MTNQSSASSPSRYKLIVAVIIYSALFFFIIGGFVYYSLRDVDFLLPVLAIAFVMLILGVFIAINVSASDIHDPSLVEEDSNDQNVAYL